MLSSMICGAPNMRHGRNAFAWKKAFCCCFVVSNLSGKRICSFFWQFLCFIFAFFFSGSLMSMAPLFHTFLWGQAFRNLHKLVRRDGMIINMVPAAGCWPKHGVVEYEPRFFQSMAGRIRLWGGVDFTTLLTLLYAEEKNHPVTLNHPIMSMQVQLAMKSSIFHFIVLAYQWSNEEVRFFWALIYDLVESVSDGWDVACVAGSWFTHERVLNIYLYTAWTCKDRACNLWFVGQIQLVAR